MQQLILGSQTVHLGARPYFIAEIGVNHEGSLEKAKEMVSAAAAAGAQAAKFQTYKAETLASRHSPAYWDTTKEATTSQFELFKKHDSFNEAEYLVLADHCREKGIDFLSTPFDLQAVDFLNPLMPFFKVASADLTNLPLLRRVAGKGKPVVLSTGASTLAEIDMAVAELQAHGAAGVGLLHCVLKYPTPYDHANLGMIDGLRRAYPDFLLGYSDHTLPDPAMAILTAAVVKGAVIIEKHFTLDKTLPGNDHYHAMDPDDLRRFVANVDLLMAAEGSSHKAPLSSEAIARANARRSIVLDCSVSAGEVITEDVIICKRPGFGISPLHWDEVVGQRALRDLPADHILSWADLTQ